MDAIRDRIEYDTHLEVTGLGGKYNVRKFPRYFESIPNLEVATADTLCMKYNVCVDEDDGWDP